MPARSRPLRVYVTQIGLTRWAVAAPSQKAALAAWDVRDNLFASGAAAATEDPRAVALAMKTPGVPVALDRDQRAAELGRVIRLDEHRAKVVAKKPAQRTLPKAEAKPAVEKSKPSSKQKAKPPPKPKPDRARLTAAEEALSAFQKRAIRDRRALLREREELAAKIDRAERDLADEEAKLKRAVEQERRRYQAELE